MKGFAPPPEDDEDDDAGMDCPSCGARMRKVVRLRMVAELEDGPGKHYTVSDGVEALRCDECGHRESPDSRGV